MPLHIDAADCLEEARKRCGEGKKKGPERRGRFKTMRCGISHGGGQTHPRNLSNTKKDQAILDWLNNKEAFDRFAGFASCKSIHTPQPSVSNEYGHVAIMATWAPALHDFYSKQLGALYVNDPSLKKTFKSSAFASTTYNLGPNTVCFPHKDFANLAFGLCSVTALGRFDPTKGGHLVLWELGLVIEFPPGSTILLPSATVTHSNTSISEGETRYSFTQYAAGGLFRWVDNHFQTAEAFLATRTPEELVDVEEKKKGRWSFGLSLFPRLPFASKMESAIVSDSN